MPTTIMRLLILAVLTASPGVNAQGVRVVKTIGLALANEAASAAIAECAGQGHAISAAVVDPAGHIKALQRADGASPHTLDSSRRKAYTAVALRLDTSAALGIARKNPEAVHLGDIDGFLLLGGGVPIRASGEVIGAIGVGGAPGDHLDEGCAAAGIAAIQGRLK
ncbi:MAG: heme-binding protein [Betaproteobacteria bacterium]|nr:heme-binding protein [Betaproteobacteria bacterium]